MLGGALNALCSDALTRWGVPRAAVGVLARGTAEFEAFRAVRLGGGLFERR